MHLYFRKPNRLQVIVLFLPWLIPGLELSLIGGIFLLSAFSAGTGWFGLVFGLIFICPLSIAIRQIEIRRYYFDRGTMDVQQFYWSFHHPFAERQQSSYPLQSITTLTLETTSHEGYDTRAICKDKNNRPVGALRLAYKDAAIVQRIATFIGAAVN